MVIHISKFKFNSFIRLQLAAGSLAVGKGHFLKKVLPDN